MALFEPIFQSHASSSAHLVPYKLANGAIIVAFAFLVPLLTMEINYFRLGVFRNRYLAEREARRRAGGRLDGSARESSSDGSSSSRGQVGDGFVEDAVDSIQEDANSSMGANPDDASSIDEETISSILLDSNILTNQLCDNTSIHQDPSRQAVLSTSYSAIRKSSLFTILLSITLYLVTAVGIIVNTRGLEEKVVLIIGGASKFVASVLVFIVSAKIPQWVSSHGCIILDACVHILYMYN